jgi:hypothetical protein
MNNSKSFFAWILLYLFAVLLIIAGVQGSAGRMLAVALCPSKLDVQPAVLGPYGPNWIEPFSTQQAVYQ